MKGANALGPTLGRVAHLARARMDARLSQYDLTPAQTHVLLYLSRHGGQAMQCELTEFLRVKPPTANGILDRLAEKQMVERTVSDSDARRRLITLTPLGKKQTALSREGFLEVELLMVRGFTADEIAQFRGLLSRMIQNLEEDETPC